MKRKSEISWIGVGLVVLVVAAAGCGSDSEGVVGARAETEPAVIPSTDGAVTRPDGRVIHNWGDRRERARTIAVFRDLVADFRASRMAGACEHVSDAKARCPRRLRRLAGTVERRGTPTERLKILWVRYYSDISGIWVEDADGKRFRVPFRREGDDWRLELGDFPQAAALNAELVGP